ncbi:MAG: portal protein [Candidatus Thorarchaeota archaeon]|jgi:hypothetical protein
MSWQLFDRLAAFFKHQNLYRRESLFIDQHRLDRITSGGQLLNFANQNALLEQTNLQINRLERYKDFDQMDEVGEIKLALDLYAAEASLLDPELKHAITIKAKSNRVKEELESLFYETLMIDNQLRPMIRYLCKTGDFPAEIIPTKNRNGVMNFKFMNVYNFTRIETKYGDLVGFFYQDQHVAEPVFLHPWQVMHLRLTSFENIYHPYGRSLLDGARKHFKQLRLMEDAALIYRITRAPEKRVFTIPVGNIPTPEVEQYIESIARQFKKKQFFDPSTGDVNERWHPLIQEDDFWLPQRADGTGPTITTLPGAENLDDIKDIEYFKKKMVSALKVPFDRVGLGDGPSTEERSLTAVDPVFAKEVQWIQREVAVGLKKIAIVHLALAGFKEKDLRDFDIHMTASSAIDELYRIETWQSRANVIESLRATEMFPKKWILKRFTNMTDDEIDDMEEEMAEMQATMPQMDQGMGGAMGGMPPPGGEEALPPGEPVPLDVGGPPMGGEMPPMGGMPPLPEDYDTNIEQQLIVEHRKYEEAQRKPINEDRVYSGYDHYATNLSNKISESKLHSGYTNMLNNCQLDGLSTFTEDEDGKHQEEVLIESYLNKSEVKEAKDRAKMLLTEQESAPEDEITEITPNDLPSRRVFVE